MELVCVVALCEKRCFFTVKVGDTYALLVYVLLDAFCLSHFYIYLFTAIGLLPGGSGYFTCKQNMNLVTTRFNSGGLHEKHVVATWNPGNHLSICI